jgi:hypothetical protein
MKGIGWDSMGAFVEYDLAPSKNEYLVVIDRSGDVIVRKMELSEAEAKLVESRMDIYSVIRMDKLNSLKMLSLTDLGDEEDN